MDYRKKLFTNKKLYDHKGSDACFLNTVKRNVLHHTLRCSEYARLLKSRNFQLKQLETTGDLYKIPVIPTLYLKTHRLRSMAQNKMIIQATSSGTKGRKSHIGFDLKSLYYGAYMVLRTASFHKLLSITPTNYIMLSYQPSKDNHTIIVKTALGATFFAPALHKTFALKPSPEGYQLDLKGLKEALLQYSRQPLPVRLIGFPAYMLFFLKELKKSGISVALPKGSKVLLGGGWKQFYTEKVEKKALYAMIEEVLGINEENCREFFGAVEHPIIYCDCKNHHFHVPVYSRVIIRDIETLLPVQNGEIGLVNLITPMLSSMPLVSVMTDDLGVLHDGRECGCGITAPYFEIIGRVGVQGIKTCAAGAEELLGR